MVRFEKMSRSLRSVWRACYACSLEQAARRDVRVARSEAGVMDVIV